MEWLRVWIPCLRHARQSRPFPKWRDFPFRCDVLGSRQPLGGPLPICSEPTPLSQRMADRSNGSNDSALILAFLHRKPQILEFRLFPFFSYIHVSLFLVSSGYLNGVHNRHRQIFGLTYFYLRSIYTHIRITPYLLYSWSTISSFGIPFSYQPCRC